MIFMEIAFLYVLASIDAPLWVYIVFLAGAVMHAAIGMAKE